LLFVTYFDRAPGPIIWYCACPPDSFARILIRGDFSARFLFDGSDIWRVSRAVDVDLHTSSLYLAHFSTFYAPRAPSFAAC
jgi:hypothetical protein